jgi:tetratricopeptide (TPR) repeat protein
MKKIILIYCFLYSSYTFGENLVSNLVEPAQYFINHVKEIEQLHNELLRFNKTGITGISGIGKTQLVKTYAYKNKERYKLIWFFDCEKSLDGQFALLAREINKNLCVDNSCSVDEATNTAKESVMVFLSSRKDWLMIFDNLGLNSNEKIMEIIKNDYNGKIIICSQDSKNLSKILQLNYLTELDTISLLNKIIPERNPEELKTLYEMFKGYPLLIVQSAIYLSNNKFLSILEYKALFENSENPLKTHFNLVMEQIPQSTKDLLIKISIINTQNFSKQLLNIITDYKLSFLQDLENMIRFGLISVSKKLNDNNEEFEMHNLIRDIINEDINKSDLKNQILAIIDNLKNIVPLSFANKNKFLSEDKTFLSNLEVIDVQAENNGIDILKILEIKRNLMDLYLVSLDYYNCEKMVDWLNKKMEENALNISEMNDYQKSILSWYLSSIGTYEDFAKADHINALKYLNQSKEVIGNTDGLPELKFTIYSQLAQTQIYSGLIKDGEINLEFVKKTMENYPEADYDIGLHWFLVSKLNLVKGIYSKALEAISESIKFESNLPQNSFTAAPYILKAEILSYLANFQEAKIITKKIYDQEVALHNNDHEIQARALTQLSRAENGLKEQERALYHAQEAKKIYINDRLRNNDNILTSHDTELASSYIAEGNALSSLGHFDKALESYTIAESIFFNCFGENIKFIDEVSDLYLAACNAACLIKDKLNFHKFYNNLITKFGENHFRTKEALKLQCF